MTPRCACTAGSLRSRRGRGNRSCRSSRPRAAPTSAMSRRSRSPSGRSSGGPPRARCRPIRCPAPRSSGPGAPTPRRPPAACRPRTFRREGRREDGDRESHGQAPKRAVERAAGATGLEVDRTSRRRASPGSGRTATSFAPRRQTAANRSPPRKSRRTWLAWRRRGRRPRRPRRRRRRRPEKRRDLPLVPDSDVQAAAAHRPPAIAAMAAKSGENVA